MAIEITESVEPTKRYGQLLPVIQLPALRHSSVAAGSAAFKLHAKTSLITVIPDVAIRIRIANTQAGAAAGAGDVFCQANIARDFEVPAGWWLGTVAA